MRFKMLCAVGLALVSVGCGTTKILEAQFSSGSGSPAGSIPGNPTDDHITVQNNSNPTLNAGNLDFSGGGNAYFFSRPVQVADDTKTISFVGKLESGKGPVNFWFQGGGSPGTPFPTVPLQLRIANTGFQLKDQSGTVLGSGGINQGEDHQVFVSVRLDNGTYYVSVKQVGMAEHLWTGSLHPATLNYFKAQPRLLMIGGFAPGGNGKYVLRSVLMKEKE